ncbi:hypothetical protein NHQ30_001233 [Ciborinia camelliae]|nr:hypothetical protein NHQ30_001233 [Ciborinia camelliae]
MSANGFSSASTKDIIDEEKMLNIKDLQETLAKERAEWATERAHATKFLIPLLGLALLLAFLSILFGGYAFLKALRLHHHRV